MKSIYICRGLGVRGRGGALYWWRYPLLATFILLFGLSAHLSIEIFKNVGNHWQGAGGSLDGVAPLAAASASPKRNHWKMMELRRPKNNMSYVVYNTIIEQQQQQQQQQRAAAATILMRGTVGENRRSESTGNISNTFDRWIHFRESSTSSSLARTSTNAETTTRLWIS